MANDIQQECPFVNYRTDGVGYCSYYRRVCRLEESEHDCSVIPLLKIGIADIITDVFHNTIRYYLEEVDPAKAEDLEYSLLPDYLHPKSTIVKEHAERLGIPLIDIPLSGVAMHEILQCFLSYRVPKTTPRWRRICNRILRRKELSYPRR